MEPGYKDPHSHLSGRLDSLCVAVIQLTPPSNLKNQAVTPHREVLFFKALYRWNIGNVCPIQHFAVFGLCSQQ